MHVGVKEAVAQRLGEELAHDQNGDSPGIMTGGRKFLRAAHRCTFHPFGGEDARCRTLPIDGRNAELGIVLCTLQKFGCGCGLHAKIELDRDACRERVDESPHAQTPCLGKKRFGPTRGKGESRKVARKIRLDGGPQNLHGHFARQVICRGCAMHLRDRSRRDWFAERSKQRWERRAKSAFDFELCYFRWKRRQPVLQRGQRAGRLVTYDVRTRRENLPKFYVGRAKLFKRECKTSTRRQRRVRCFSPACQ